MTYSIIAFDQETQTIGSAVASKWTGVGGCTQFFRPHVGFVNLQNHSYAPTAYRILDAMEQQQTLTTSLETALEKDPMKEKRQCVIANMTGDFHVYSGTNCSDTFHHSIGNFCAAAGNTVFSRDVIEKMVQSYEASTATQMAERLLQALEAGQKAGGDIRGQEAAAIKVYQLSYPQQQFYPVDLRVDSSEEPLKELRKIYKAFGDKTREIVQ